MQDVTFRAYGIKLDIAPEVTATGKIKTQLSAEVSNLDPAVSVNGVPGILTRRTDSVFLADDNDTLVLSGLMSHERSRSESQTPAMGDLPVIGQLFRSRDLREQQTELVIMVTAERLDMAQQRLNAKNQRLEQQTNWLSEAGCVGLQEVTDE
jgi:pilus assembly protein CpaC